MWLIHKPQKPRITCFNPHTHEGCDFAHSFFFKISKVFQSTHPRRVWQPYQLSRNGFSLFQSTHPRRVWPYGCCGKLRVLRFNPHTHEGCDRPPSSPSYHSVSFNPHTHEGCDATSFYDKGNFLRVSIHTPTKGVTLIFQGRDSLQMFQSTHPRRVWL